MVQASPHVTAAQVLDAGRRAEADGRVEYAVQFYRHLTDHHAGAPEAAAARQALSRLKQQTTTGEGMPRARPASPPPLRTSAPRGSAEPHVGKRVGRGPIRIAPAGSTHPPDTLELPETDDEYTAGRLLARGLAGLGILAFASGLLIAAAALLLPAEMIARAPDWLPAAHPVAGAIGAAAGIALFLAGQLARAVFDMASASRDIAAIERAKLEHASAALR